MIVAVSRTIDYHHNFSDILAGSLIGAVISYICYFLYFPDLSDPASDQPKISPRLKEMQTEISI
jgi:diacylglycerol diphosphate phosphatase/phosphatidate phosphatase